jgi:Bax protein
VKDNLSYLKKIKRIFLKKRYKFIKKKSKLIQSNFKSFYQTIFVGIFLIFIFAVIPKTITIATKIFSTSEVITNKSKSNFEKILKSKQLELKKVEKEKKKATFNDLFIDIFEFESVEGDAIRLSASTLKQLFEDTKYNLNDVRKNKVVKPVSINLLPNEIKNIESSKKRKQLFIQIVLPLILEENERIKLDRKRLFVILNKNNNTESERKWLKNKLKQYGVVNKELAILKIRLDEIPVSLAIAQAAKETGWGTSRFALKGNALFGQWTWNGDGMKPTGIDDQAKHKIMRFNVLQASVRAYQRNLNTHSSYKEFRKARAIQRDNKGELNSLELVDYLDKYAQTGKEYTRILKMIIQQNLLQDFDDAKLLPSSEKIKKLI